MRALKKIVKAVAPEIAFDIYYSSMKYKNAHGRIPNIIAPRSFNEKIVRRSLLDNNPLLRTFADKYAVRSFVEERVGSDILPKIYHCADDPSDIPFDQLPDRFVVKPTHGSGWVIIVRSREELDKDKIISECRYWLSTNFYEVCKERIYKDISRRILVEEYIDDGSAISPVDYKFHVFHGEVRFVNAIHDRFASCKGYLRDRNWDPVGAEFEADAKNGVYSHEPPPTPPRFRDMVRIAETLGSGIDFVRVDLYSTEKQIYFGEMTATPGAGLDTFNPRSFDLHLGSLW